MNEILQQVGYVVLDRFHPFDPETEDLIYGADLQDGMVVLIEPMFRHSADSTTSNAIDRLKLNVENRWCEVTKRMFMEDAGVAFIGVYADGHKAARFSYKSQGWVLKLDATPAKDTGEGWDTMDKTKLVTLPVDQTAFQKYQQGPRDLTIDDTK